MRIAITGATGFVGGRLAERLVMSGDADIVGIVRRFSGSGLARLARLPIRMDLADLTDRTALGRAFEACDAVVHCAYGTSGTPEERHSTTVDGTRVVLESAAESGVDRVIHVSSTVVYGSPRSGSIDEAAPVGRPRTPYDRMKLDAENVVRSFHAQHGYPVVVLRPPLIYGPYGRRWTMRIVQEIMDGGTLIEEGRGAANFLHVDNLVDAILAAVTSQDVLGEAVNVIDREPLTWADVYEGYRSLLPGAPPLRSMTLSEIEAERRRLEPGMVRGSVVLPAQLAPGLVREAVSSKETRSQLKQIPWVRGLATLTRPYRAKRKAGAAPGVGPEPHTADGAALEYALPDAATVELQTSTARYDGAKARRLLGETAHTSWDEALARLRPWLVYQRLAPPSGG